MSEREEYKKGFLEGMAYAKETYSAHTGQHSKSLPDWFVHRGNVRSCGFGEGIITGRSEVMQETFGKFKSISWPNAKAEVIY